MKSLLVFSYYSFKDPIFQSAVLPYFTNLNLTDHRFILLTWEQKQYQIDKNEVKQIKDELKSKNIFWYHTKWHSGRFKLLKKIYDFFWGICFSIALVIRHDVKAIYSEGFPGAIIGFFISLMVRKKHIVHTFEPHADDMLYSGVWSKKSWEYKLLKRLELLVGNQAYAIITATHAYKSVLIDKGVKSKILVIPSCIDTKHYKFVSEKREEIRKEMGIKADQVVIAYLGKLGGVYMDDELFRFFSNCLANDYGKFHFCLFTNEPKSRISQYLEKFRINPSKIFIKHLDKNEVPGYLSSVDFGASAIKPIKSQRYSSPIKNGEYWACGLPIIIPEGISDDYLFVEKDKNLGFVFNYKDDLESIIDNFKISYNRNYIREFAEINRGLYNNLGKIKEIICEAMDSKSK